MKLSVLERLLQAERHRQRASLAPPILDERLADPTEGPWLVTNTKGSLVQTKINEKGYVWQVFTNLPIEEEDALVASAYRSLVNISRRNGWKNRCATLEGAASKLTKLGFEPKTLVVPYSLLAEVCGKDLSEEEAEHLTLAKGYVTEVNGIRVISARQALPTGAAILAALPDLVGRYTRIYDHLALTFHRADRALILVGADAVD